ncbi:MAG: DNA-formamidopyrimidine glycosylase [Dehalococcoidia bacterium]|nr:DNA-formamidopyrimidine glycosylase [Dehalococcoidia bacterium]
MPELPEVETIVNSLRPRVVGKTIIGIVVRDTRPIQQIGVEEFCRRLMGRSIRGLSRRGKYIIFSLSHKNNLVVHLRMTGALLWNPAGPEPFSRLEFVLDDRSKLVYTDVRRFGTFCLARDAGKIVGKLGIEPLNKEFTRPALAAYLGTRSTPVKTALLNQERIAGIGNMYADEALFAAGIHPLRPSSSLKPQEIAALHRSIRAVLKKAVKNQGASIRNYRQPDGEAGRAHEEFAVAHRGGQACPHCSTTITRIVVGQRGTYLCPHCQTAPGMTTLKSRTKGLTGQ